MGGKAIRLERLFDRRSGRLVIVPLDHSITDGPITDSTDRLVGRLSENGVDAVVLHKGRIAHVQPQRLGSTALIVHLSASTRFAPDPNAKRLVAQVAEASRLGADAVSVHVNLGSIEEDAQLSDLAAVADDCEQWGIPLLAMMYPRGPKISDPNDLATVAHAATIATDLGADIVKCPMVRTAEEMTELTHSCPIPVVVAGGARTTDRESLLTQVKSALIGGAAGVAIGRNVFEADDPGEMAYQISELVHGFETARPEKGKVTR